MNGNGHKAYQSRTNRDWYWVCAISKDYGRPIVNGPHHTESEGMQWGFANIPDEDFKVYAFPTVNKITARDMFKSKGIEQTKNLDIAFKRAMYKV